VCVCVCVCVCEGFSVMFRSRFCVNVCVLVRVRVCLCVYIINGTFGRANHQMYGHKRCVYIYVICVYIYIYIYICTRFWATLLAAHFQGCMSCLQRLTLPTTNVYNYLLCDN
jgi:hypothetical protein